MYVDIVGMLNQMSDEEIQNWASSLTKEDVGNLYKTQSLENITFIYGKIFGKSCVTEHMDIIYGILDELENMYNIARKDRPLFQHAIYDLYKKYNKNEVFTDVWDMLGTLLIEDTKTYSEMEQKYNALPIFMSVMQYIKDDEFNHNV